ncbi:MAG TPA: tetratricopeptide repeat protein [Candidatus Eisenbacteria bacterium]|nr:tetratricopeptide repeat protein [Candidatus Eisenbacteria bacterium]
MFASKRNLILILIAVTFLAYFSSLGNPFIWDDEQFITSNQYVQSFDIEKIFTTNTVAGAGVVSNYYRPLTTLSFAIDTKIWSSNVFGFHLANLLLHIGAGIVLFGLLGELGISLLPSFFIALFFLIHPIQTEAVTYINSRGDSLYALFLFGSLWLFTKTLRLNPKSQNLNSKQIQNTKYQILDTTLVVFLFILSLLSKEIALAGIGLYFLVWWLTSWSSRAKSRDLKQNIQQKEFLISNFKFLMKTQNTKYVLSIIGAICIITMAYVVLRLTVLNFGNTLNFYGGENEYTRSLAIRLFTFCKVLWLYVGLLVWPYPLHMERTVDLVRSFWSPWVWGTIGLVGGVGLVGWIELKKKRTAWILFGMSWFLIMLIPSSGIIPINGILYEHWLYVPAVGFFIMVYGLLQFLIYNFQFLIKSQNTKYQIQNTFRKILYIFVILLCLLYLFLTIRQNNLWADQVQFYRYTLSFAPDSARLHNNLGMTLANQGDVKGAIPEYKKALSLGYGYPQIYNNLGNAYRVEGEYGLAEKNLKRALQLSPEFTVARINLIKLYVESKQFDKALELARGNKVLIQEIERLRSQ